MSNEYNERDVRDAYSTGFWVGAVTGAGTMFLFCLFIGLYL